MVKPLNNFEKIVAELTWGSIPNDVDWVRNSALFQEQKKQMEKAASPSITSVLPVPDVQECEHDYDLPSISGWRECTKCGHQI